VQYLEEVRRRKDLLLYLVSSDLRAQHRNTFLGYLWWLLDPILNLIIYYFVVGIVFRRGGPDYILHLIVALSVWRWFQATLTTATRSIVSRASIISQVYLPKVIFPLSTALTQAVNFGFSLIVVFIFILLAGRVPGLELVWLPLVIGAQLIFTIALALPLAYISVFVRDMDNLTQHLMRLWFYASPVVWTVDFIPQAWLWVVNINPMAYFLSAYRNILLYQRAPNVVALLSIASLSLACVVCTGYFYSRNEHRMIKVL